MKNNFEYDYSYDSEVEVLYVHRAFIPVNVKGDLDTHTMVTLRIKNVSRAVLTIEFVRHDDLLSPTIKSTRYTLKELKEEKHFNITQEDFKRAKKYIVFTGNFEIDKNSVLMLEQLRQNIINGIPNDEAKYNLPECYKTEGVFTMPLRNLKNIVKLRTDKSAIKEFQDLAYKIKEKLDL
jgi:thymidylate synthase (FAD)